MGLFDWLKIGSAKHNAAIALDIGTEFVKALIFTVEARTARVAGVGKVRQRLSDMQGGSVTDIHGVITNCEEALSQAAEQANILPEQVIMGIAGELVKGITTSVKIVRRNSEEKINLQELQEILEKVQVRAYKQAQEILAWETGNQEIDVRLISSAIVDVAIDGYKVTNPLGFQGKEIKIGIYSAFSPIVHLGALQTIAEELSLDLISVAAEPYAVARVLNVDEPTELSAIFIDIGGGTTDVAIVNNGGLLGTKTYALGGRAFTKRLMNMNSISFADAEQLKLKYADGKLKDKQSHQIAQALLPDIDIWFSGLEITLGEFTNTDLLPSRILLCGGGSKLPDITHKLEHAKWDKHLPFARKPTVHFLEPKSIGTIIDQTGSLTTVQDVTPMALANLAIDLVGKPTLKDRIMGQIMGSLKA